MSIPLTSESLESFIIGSSVSKNASETNDGHTGTYNKQNSLMYPTK